MSDRSTLDAAWAPLENEAPLEEIRTAIPGPRSLELARTLANVEAREVTCMTRDFPVFWECAEGSIITDADGNRFIDCSAAFGVAAVGHANPHVVAAVHEQTARMMHGMGDVHPTGVRARFLTRLAARAPGRLTHSYLGLNGADAIEFARKTAFFVNAKPRALVFSGAYHGLSYGTLALTGLLRFREPFKAQIPDAATIVPYPVAGSISLDAAVESVEAALRENSDIGAIFIEPIAGRAGTLVPPAGFLAALRRLANTYGAVLVFDEIYTGFGRTGTWFACENEAEPDILCLGKAIAGGMPLSVAIGTPEIMNAWPASNGEALHTATFLGSPPACAAGLAVLDELENKYLPERAAALGTMLGHELRALAHRLSAFLPAVPEVRGRGLMWALDLHDGSLAAEAMVHALKYGVIILPQGMAGTALAFTPPLIIARRQLVRALELIEAAITDAWKARPA